MARILAVDDSPSVRELLAYTLAVAGHEVLQAEDGEKALEVARSAAVDLVITDVNMPGMDGIALVEALRPLPAYRFVPILVLTTESDPERKQAGRKAGATGWIVKPFEPERLLAAIARVLD